MSVSMRLLASAIVLYTIVFSGIALWKYDALRYNARDLAIYSQVLWNVTNGESGIGNQGLGIIGRFSSSIQGHNYLGDHVEPVLLFLMPFYALFPDPRTLLMLQTLALALAAIPLYLITSNLTQRHPELDSGSRNKNKQKKRFAFSFLDSRFHGNDMAKNWLPALIGLLWLLHPAVQNANLYEFHTLAFAPLFLYTLFWAYLKVRANIIRSLYGRSMLRPYILFFTFLLLSLFVREDVALITFVLGLLMLWEGRKKRPLILLSLLTLCISAGWFIFAQRIISHFSPSQGYQYRIYYQWLSQSNSLGETAHGLLSHFLSLPNLEMLIGLLLPLLFLPLIKPAWLLLALPPLLSIMLSQSGGGALIWQTHYGLLLLPGIFLAFIHAIGRLRTPVTAITPIPSSNKNRLSIVRSWYRQTLPPSLRTLDPSIFIVSITAAAIASTVAFGPIVSATRAAAANYDHNPSTKTFIASISPSASVATTDRFLALLSSRRDLVLLPLWLLGTQQYGTAPYALEEFPPYILLNEEDVWADLVQAHTLAWTQPYATDMRTRFRKILSEGNYRVMNRQGNAILLARGTEQQINNPPFSFEERALDGMTGGLVLDRLGSVRLVVD